jgi:tRNA-dihydrouridine synthase C
MKAIRIQNQIPALVLAPMEGVTDFPMRALQSERGGFSFCVSEFIRVSQDVLPIRTFLEQVPELRHSARTHSGTPVQVQLLGGNEERMALSALQAIRAGATAIDLNFGCPAPTVNRHDGGASLLRSPTRIRSVVSAVRAAVPSTIPVSAKLRLGWENMSDIFINAEQAVLGGASWLTIHARTKVQGYTPPAHWKYIGEVKKHLQIPIVANGEIWSHEDFLKCRDLTQCEHFMIGRGALAQPLLPQQIARSLGLLSTSDPEDLQWNHTPAEWVPLLKRFSELAHDYAPHSQYALKRMKQWMGFVKMKHPLPWIEPLRKASDLNHFFQCLQDSN